MKAWLMFLILSLVFFVVKAQHQIELQFLGDSITEEEAIEKDLCETKYCLLDANLLFYAATQNKSVRPCEDFKEFALGTFIKYQSVSDRHRYAGFLNNFDLNYAERLRNSLAAPVNEKDTRVTKGMKKLFAKCVSSRYIERNGVREVREHARSLGLNFYPESNSRDFHLKSFVEKQPELSLLALFEKRFNLLGEPFRLKDSNTTFLLGFSGELYREKRLESYADMLYDMNQIYLNSTFSDQFREEFREIADKQLKFYKEMKKAEPEGRKNVPRPMTIQELNELTASLNLDWRTIISNMLVSKVGIDELILVYQPEKLAAFANFLSTQQNEAIADFLVYFFLFEQSETFIVYSTNEYQKHRSGAVKARQRWHTCLDHFYSYMSPALSFLYLLKYRDDELKNSMENFVRETIGFLIRKLNASDWGENVIQDVTERLQSIKLIVGYSDELIDPEVIEEIYSGMNLGNELTLSQSFWEIRKYHYHLTRNPDATIFRQFLRHTFSNGHTFRYSLLQNTLFINYQYLSYPFYHHQRPRFFNTATVSNFIFRSLFDGFAGYLKKKYNLENTRAFPDFSQSAYEFYDDWLKSGGKEFELGANRMTDRQLFWIAVARFEYTKFKLYKESNPFFDNYHNYTLRKRGFAEAFKCKHSNGNMQTMSLS